MRRGAAQAPPGNSRQAHKPWPAGSRQPDPAQVAGPLSQTSSRPRCSQRPLRCCKPWAGAVPPLVAVRDRLQLGPTTAGNLLQVTGRPWPPRVICPRATRSLPSPHAAASKRPDDRLFPRCLPHLCRHCFSFLHPRALPSRPAPTCSVDVDGHRHRLSVSCFVAKNDLALLTRWRHVCDACLPPEHRWPSEGSSTSMPSP